jgi:hypothetical protein
VITRSEHRNTQALHAKIDELLRTHGEARKDLTRLDERDIESIEKHRQRHRERDDTLNHGPDRSADGGTCRIVIRSLRLRDGEGPGCVLWSKQTLRYSPKLGMFRA